MLGRETEQAALAEFVDASSRGLTLLQLEGEPGIGKTILWSHGAETARKRGVRVLQCRPAQAEAAMAFASLSDLAGSVEDREIQRLPEPQHRALEVALLRADRGDRPPDPRAVATAVLSLLRLLADETPVLLAVDDVQWIDRASAAALAFALRRLGADTTLGVLAAVRVESGEAPDPLLLAQLAAAPLRRLSVGPLDAVALRGIVDADVRGDLARPMRRRIELQSAGNPLFALELGRALGDGGGRPQAGEPLPLPGSLRALVSSRTGRLPSRTNFALLALALMAHPSEDLLQRVTGRPLSDLYPAFDAKLIERRAGRLRFTHPLYAAAAAGAAPLGRRRDLHRKLAEAVGDPEERARHLAAATDGPDAEVARELEAGAEVARSRGAWGSAAELLERAHVTTPRDRPDRARRAIAAAEHHVHAGDRARGRALIQALLEELPAGFVRADALRLLGEISSDDENFHEAERLFLESLAQAEGTRVAVLAELGLAYVRSNLMDWRRAGEHASRALSLAEALGQRSLAAAALAHVALMDFLSGRGADLDRADRAVGMEDRDALVPALRSPRVLRAVLDLYTGEHEAARAQLETFSREAAEHGDESDLAFVLLWLSWLETRAGDLGRAVEHAAQAVSLALVTGSTSTHAWALTQHAFALAHTGRVEEARGLCEDAARPVQASGNLLPPLWIAATGALAGLSVGDPARAWQAAEAATERIEVGGLAEPVPAFFLPDAIEALIGVGELERATGLLDLLEQRGRELDRVWAVATGARVRSLLEAERGDLNAAQAAIELALDQHERIELGFERARALLAQGMVERRAGRRKRAREAITGAQGAFEAMGAVLWAERAGAELARLPVRRAPASDELTPAEARTAELVAEGRTNREVAGILFVSEKAVEANLTRIYRKLGVRSRAALAARMARSTNS